MKNLMLAACLLCATASFAQYSVTGKITGGDTGEPIAFANVILHRQDVVAATTLSDPSGLFRLEKLGGGVYEIELRYMGYVTHLAEVSLGADLDMGTVVMMPDSFMVEGVEVVAKKQQVIYKFDKRVIDAGSDVVAGGGTAGDIISRLPSVRMDIDGNISFRGSTGFIVQVNGKPSMFTAAQALQQIPAGQIENIEVITTPSARDRTDGDAGIINIITKQRYGEGFSGAVNVTGSTYGSRGADFNLMKRSGEHSFTLGGIYGQRIRKSDFEQEKVTRVGETTTTSHSKGPRSGEYYSYILQAGWQLAKPRTNYYVDLTGGYEGHANKGDLNYSETVSRPAASDVVNNRYISKDDYDIDETILSGSAGFDHKFAKEGHTLKAHFYLKYGGDAMEKFTSDLFDDNDARQQGHEAWEAEHRWTVDGSIDYVYPYSSTGRIEAGYQYFSYLEDGDYEMYYWNPAAGQFDYRDDIYNTFYFQRGINTLYLLANQRAGKFEFQAGVRAEHTHQVLRSSREWANRTEDRLEFFPSAHVGYSPNQATRLTAAYSRRTNRPQLFYMEPYITYRDYYTAEKGNPDIRPEYIDSYELSVKKDIGQQTVNAALFHRSRTDKIERLRIPYEAGITLDSMANVGNDYSTGLELGLDIRTGRVWSFTVNGDVYYYSVKNKLASGGENRSSVNFGLSLNNNIRLGANTAMQLDAVYIGPTVRTQGREAGFFYADFGMRRQFLEGRLTAGLSFRNFLNTARYRSDIDSGGLNSHTTILPRYPLLTLNVGYVFNNYRQRAKGREGSDFFEGTNY